LAKKTDHLAGDLEADDTSGLLSGLLAEEDDLDRRSLWRIGSWGVGAVGAVVIAVMANQSSLGIKRDQVAAADISRQAQQIQLVARETQNEARRLSSAIDTLNGDRDRLYTRVTSLEQGLDSVTGAIARQGSTSTSPPAAAIDPQAVQNQPPAPSVAPVATTQPSQEKPAVHAAADPNAAAASSLPKIEAAKPDIAKSDRAKDRAKADTVKADVPKVEAAKADVAKPGVAKTDEAVADVEKPSPAMPLVSAKSMMAPPDPAAAKLVEPGKPVSPVTSQPIPEVVALAPAATEEEADEATAEPRIALQKTQFGVDLGSANSVAGLRALWQGLLKSRSNAPLKALRPIITVKESAKGLGMQLRLVAGPLNDAGAAARICAALTESKRACETTVFDGQRLSLKSEDQEPPAANKPAQRRRSAAAPRRAAVVEESKKPEPAPVAATPSASERLSSWFGRKNSQ
jgi:hypothetical protein